MKEIDLNLYNNFGISFKKRPRFLPPVGRPNDIISTIAGVIANIVVSAGIAGTAATVGLISYGLATVVVVAAIGLSVWQTIGGKKYEPSPTLRQNAHLVNTRQASQVLPVVYGIARVGGNWVFSRPSRKTNTILNNVITWSEGEIEGLGTAIDYTPLYSGTTLNDIQTGGEFIQSSCSCFGPCFTHQGCQTCDIAQY